MLIKVLLEFHRRIVAFFCLRVDEPINGDGGGRGGLIIGSLRYTMTIYDLKVSF